MRSTIIFYLEKKEKFIKNFTHWLQKYEVYTFLNSNSIKDQYSKYDFIAGISVEHEFDKCKKNPFDELQSFNKINHDWMFGYFSYDLKNYLEKLESKNIDKLKFPEIYFFKPTHVVYAIGNVLYWEFPQNQFTNEQIVGLFKEIVESKPLNKKQFIQSNIQKRISKEQYINSVLELKKHIALGDIYEANFCQEFYINDVSISPASLYLELCKLSPMPFSCLMKLHDKFVICASPERFIQKTGKSIISQPIKGTVKRGLSELEDKENKAYLQNSIKEKAENVMIVDLVRNDLSITAEKGSVEVENMFEIKSFKHVHQMVSTVKSIFNEKYNWIDAIKHAYPMGSMTGAPKISAMQLIEKYESTKRGVYSGSIGYITPNEDFDFNVVIRSFLYNQSEKYLSYMAGGAITHYSEPEKEYEESLLKANSIFKLLKNKNDKQ